MVVPVFVLSQLRGPLDDRRFGLDLDFLLYRYGSGRVRPLRHVQHWEGGLWWRLRLGRVPESCRRLDHQR